MFSNHSYRKFFESNEGLAAYLMEEAKLKKASTKLHFSWFDFLKKK